MRLSLRWISNSPRFALVWAALALPLHAQSTGTIQGRVYNPASQEYVRSAEVRLEGTNQSTFTENDGFFQFSGLPAGTVSVVVTYSGYATAKHTFEVLPGQTVVREITLVREGGTSRPGEDIVQLQAFTVSSEREGQSKAVMDQRRTMDIATAVSSDVFGDITDGNVGEFVKYLPGVDLDYVESEPRGPRLGGMDSQYTAFAFDGIRLASADANRGGDENSRATSFEGFAITSIESIEISRTTSADSDADAPAGTINMKTKRAFDRKGRRISYNVGLNFNSEEFTLSKTWGPDDNRNYKWTPNYQLEYSEAFLNQRVGVLLGVSRATSYSEFYSFAHTLNRNADPARGDTRPVVVTGMEFKDGPKHRQRDALTFTVDWKAAPNLIFSLNTIYTDTAAEFSGRNLSLSGAGNNNNADNGRSQIQGDGLTTVGTRRTATNTVPSVGISGTHTIKLTYTRTVAPKFEYKLGDWTIDGAGGFSKSINNYDALERGFNEAEGVSMPGDWLATRSSPASWEWTIRQPSGSDWFDPQSWTGGTRVENSAREWITELWNAQLNAKWALPFLSKFPTWLKFGGKWNEETRDNRNEDVWNVWRYIGPGGDRVTYNATTGVPAVTASGNWANLGFVSGYNWDTGTTNAVTMYNIAGQQGIPPRVDHTKIATLFREQPSLFAHVGTPDNYYNSFIATKRDFRQTVTSGYAMGNTKLSGRLQVQTGLRWERTDNALTEFDARKRAEVVAAGFPVNATGRATTIPGLQYQFESQPRVTRKSDYDNWFPSITAKYRIAPNLDWQAGFNKAISRPPIDRLTGLWIINEDASGTTQRVDAPNPGLQPEHSKNYQTRLAYYFAPRMPGQLSLQLAQNDIRNLRETFDFTAEEFGVDDPEFANYTFRSTRNSSERRRFRSLEVAYWQSLGFLPEVLRGTNINLTYARTYSNLRRRNLAPHRITSRLGYAHKRFNGSVGMVWRPDTPDNVRYGLYQRESTQFDLSLYWKLTNYATVYVQARNFTGKPNIWYDTPPGVVEGTSPILRLYEETGANWVFGVKGTF